MSEGLDTSVGRELLDELGFLLVPGPPIVARPPYLFVALRRRPTLSHFDPERIDFWQSVDGRGLAASIDWSTKQPAAGDYAWGVIRLVDRLGVSNEFASFGGRLLVGKVDEVKVVVFSSDAPIVALGGHSQDWEPGSREIDGYLSRLRAAADPRGALERRLAQSTPVALYACFLAGIVARYRASEQSFGWENPGTQLFEHEVARLRSEAPGDWARGEELAADPAFAIGGD